MKRVGLKNMLRNQSFQYGRRIFCLICILFSFCVLFTHLEVGVNLVPSANYDLGINYYPASSPPLQINYRYNQINLVEGIKNNKGNPSLFNVFHTAIHCFSNSQNRLIDSLFSLNSIFQCNFKRAYLLLDLPPPSI